jgi:hypothetical protein
MDALAWIIATTLVVLMIRLHVFGHKEYRLVARLVRRQAAQITQSIFLPRSPQAELFNTNRPAADEKAEDSLASVKARPEAAIMGMPAADKRKAA